MLFRKCLVHRARVILYFLLLPVFVYLLGYAIQSVRGGPALLRKERGSLILATREGPIRTDAPDRVFFQSIPSYMIDALIFQEDRAFFSHRGYAVREMIMVVKDFVLSRGRRMRGASTLTQQTARTLFLGRDRTLERKLLELRVARMLEASLTKEEILSLYLGSVYWGHSHEGLREAAAGYFGKEPRQLSRVEAAALVSILPAPDACSHPLKCDEPRTVRRREVLLAHMEHNARSRDK